MLGKDLLVKILNSRFGLKFVEILSYFEKWELFEFEYSHQFKSMTIALKLFVNPQFLILLF